MLPAHQLPKTTQHLIIQDIPDTSNQQYGAGFVSIRINFQDPEEKLGSRPRTKYLSLKKR